MKSPPIPSASAPHESVISGIRYLTQWLSCARGRFTMSKSTREKRARAGILRHAILRMTANFMIQKIGDVPRPESLARI